MFDALSGDWDGMNEYEMLDSYDDFSMCDVDLEASDTFETVAAAAEGGGGVGGGVGEEETIEVGGGGSGGEELSSGEVERPVINSQTSPHLALSGLFFYAPILGCQSGGHGTVLERLKCIIGSEIRQNELITLRRGLFKDILPQMTRDEKRNKSINVSCLEGHRIELLSLLDRQVVIRQVLHIVYESRQKVQEQRELFAHMYLLS
jgi:hypothetical protein